MLIGCAIKYKSVTAEPENTKKWIKKIKKKVHSKETEEQTIWNNAGKNKKIVKYNIQDMCLEKKIPNKWLK